MTALRHYCDQCGTEKRESNHWLALRIHGEGKNLSMVILDFSRAQDGDQHVCGSACLLRKVTAFETDLHGE